MDRRRLAVGITIATAAQSMGGCSGGCGSKPSARDLAADAGEGAFSGARRAGAEAGALGAPRAGMAWVPSGTLIAGSAVDRAPRNADEELAAVPIPMQGFYIDLLPYPNEPGAIATSNVSRADAERLCADRGKRLCTELEWERACKGAGNTTYEYGDTYRAATCNTGLPAEQAAKRPTGENATCASSFGVRDMHGGAWEWTSSAWGRGSGDPELGVLRGGNASAGELVGRCANALGRKLSMKEPTMGLRCCAGPVSAATVDLPIVQGVPIERSATPAETAAVLAPLIKAAWFKQADAGAAAFTRAWLWHPVANEELIIAGGCARVGAGLRCGAVIGRAGASPKVLAEIDTGLDYADVLSGGDPRHVRVRGLELRGSLLRDVTYAYGAVDVAAKKP
jgi:sulfatase modifying factor 1